VLSLGIDVGVRKGLDLVLLDGDRRIRGAWRGVSLRRLESVIDEAQADVVAIDAPAGWAIRGRTRQTEREIRLFGIQSFGTPTERRARGNSFYEWVRRGIRAFRIAEQAGYPPYHGGSARGRALEVFPHATAVVLAGCLPPRRARKDAWRSSVLISQGVPVEGLRGADQIDATLAALTGLLAMGRQHTALGDPVEGVIVLPVRTLPPRPYPRCRAARSGDGQVRLPGTAPCACGDPRCDRLTSREFAPGHDAKRKALLWRLAREGQEAGEELRRRGWELPPEMR
jgi:predicted nuclease with RNAse H fold